MITLTPAYGRDYKSQKEVREAFLADKDFIIADITHPYSGKPANRSQLIAETDEVKIRFSRNRKIAIVNVGGK